MTSHELARKLLEMEDIPVVYSYFDGGPDTYEIKEITGINKENDRIHLEGKWIQSIDPYENDDYEDDYEDDYDDNYSEENEKSSTPIDPNQCITSIDALIELKKKLEEED